MRRRQASAAAFLEQVDGTYNQTRACVGCCAPMASGSLAQPALTDDQAAGFPTEMALPARRRARVRDARPQARAPARSLRRQPGRASSSAS
ncbi:MAG: hypothetical protein R3C32_01310 [Chloroflexota bacterium]